MVRRRGDVDQTSEGNWILPLDRPDGPNLTVELETADLKELAQQGLIQQMTVELSTLDIEEINSNRDKFLANVASNVEAELKKIGLKLINVNVTDIKDESGYIEALGKEAAAKAINDAKQVVAEKNRDGSIGQANAMQQQRVKVADAEATAVEGENLAKIKVAQSDASRRQREAEALKLATATEKVQSAKALEETAVGESFPVKVSITVEQNDEKKITMT